MTTEEINAEKAEQKAEEKAEEIRNQKDVEFHAAAVNAWFGTRMEHDKSLLTLSAGGIGLLLTLLTTVGLTSAEALVLYIGAIISFVVALIAILFVFRHNAVHIEDIITGKAESSDSRLEKLDGIVLWAFGIGVICTAIIGVSAAIHSYSKKDEKMATKDEKSTRVYVGDSFNGVIKLQQAAQTGAKGTENAATSPSITTNSASAAASNAVLTSSTATKASESSNGSK